MKTTIKLLLIYFGLQLATLFLVLIPYAIYIISTGGDIKQIESSETITTILILSCLPIVIYLWKKGLINRECSNWSTVSFKYMVLTTLIAFPVIWLPSIVVAHLDLPNLIEETLDTTLSTWYGILYVAVLGPICEELLFRGAITKTLLKRYSPTVAIVISGLLFGVIHLNPAQMIGASCSGFLFAWMYYKTASLTPCIWLHIVNNSLAVILNYYYPHVEDLEEWVGSTSLYIGITVIAAMVLPAILALMNQSNVHYPWKGKPQTDVLELNE